MADTGTRRTELWLFITALCVGGAEQTLVDLANGLDGNWYEVTVWTIFDTNPLASDLQDDVTIRALTDAGRVENGSVVGASNPLAYLVAPLRFCYAAMRERPDIVHSFLTFDNVIAGVSGLLSPATVVTGVRSVPNDQPAFRAGLDRLALYLSDHVVSNSEAGARFAVDRGARAEAVSVVRNGRRIAEYADADPTAVESELGIGDDELVVGTVGRLLERKGHFELLTAWADVVERVPNARLLLVGDGEDRAAIEAHAAEVGCDDSVEFLGTRRDVPALLATMDVFVFPSHFEGLPGAVIEAMAAGLPIAATPVDGTAELVDGYRTGLFVPVDSPQELGWALTRLLQEPSLRRTLGHAARDRAEMTFTIDVMVDNFEQLYRDLEGAESRVEAPVPAPVEA